MADTAQFVRWHLSFACPFRRGEAVAQFVPAWNATSRLREIDDADRNGDVYGDICVVGVAYSGKGKEPCSGFRVSTAVAPVGSLEAARETCGRCPANAFLPAPGGMAGCSGHLPVDPDDDAVDAALRSAIARTGLEANFAAAFPRTRPLWYGLWITSPMTSVQLEVLNALLRDIDANGGLSDPYATPSGIGLLDGLRDGITASNQKEIRQFQQACAAALAHGIPLQVNLPPPGHTDFGIITTFPHCPRCKAHEGGRWEMTYSSTPKRCPACGHTFVPAETAAKEDDDGREHKELDLERQLSPNEYEAVRRAWHARHDGDSPNRLELLISGKLDVVSELMAESAAARATRPSLLTRLWRRLTGR